MKKGKFSMKRKEVIMILAAFAIGTAGRNIAQAAENPNDAVVNSYGALIYDDGDETNNNGREHDLVIDTSDIKNLANTSDILKQATDILKQTTDELKQTTNELSNNLGSLSFYEDESGNIYVVGADSVPKKLGLGSGVEFLGTGTSFNVSNIAGYQNFTADNFIIEPTNAYFETVESDAGFSERVFYVELTATKTYNPNTGVLNAYYHLEGGVAYKSWTIANGNVPVKAYLVF